MFAVVSGCYVVVVLIAIVIFVVIGDVVVSADGVVVVVLGTGDGDGAVLQKVTFVHSSGRVEVRVRVVNRPHVFVTFVNRQGRRRVKTLPGSSGSGGALRGRQR